METTTTTANFEHSAESLTWKRNADGSHYAYGTRHAYRVTRHGKEWALMIWTIVEVAGCRVSDALVFETTVAALRDGKGIAALHTRGRDMSRRSMESETVAIVDYYRSLS